MRHGGRLKFGRAERPGRPCPRRARRVALWLLALCAGSQFTLAWLLECGAESLRDPEFYRRVSRLHARRSAYPGRPLAVALGSSRVAMGLRPDAADGDGASGQPLCFNFGMMGAGAVLQRLEFDRLLSDGCGVGAEHKMLAVN